MWLLRSEELTLDTLYNVRPLSDFFKVDPAVRTVNVKAGNFRFYAYLPDFLLLLLLL
jgi:hypothetical protein